MSRVYWLASYPKSGNTWMRLALRSLEAGGTPVRFDDLDDVWWMRDTTSRILGIASFRGIFDDRLDVESSDLQEEEVEALRGGAYYTDTSADTFIVKTHDAYLSCAGVPLYPQEVTAGAVVIVRDPRDVAVSFASHCGQSVADSVRAMNCETNALSSSRRKLSSQLRQHLGSWSTHVQGWLDAPVARILVRYEDMLCDMPGVLRRVADFVAIAADPDAVARACAATSFDRLRAQEDISGFRERPATSAHFFRRGIAGGWKESLTAELVAEIENCHGAMMRRLGYRLSS